MQSMIPRGGKPIQNAFVESFNGRLRDELPGETLFSDLRHGARHLHSLTNRPSQWAFVPRTPYWPGQPRTPVRLAGTRCRPDHFLAAKRRPVVRLPSRCVSEAGHRLRTTGAYDPDALASLLCGRSL
ncbi:MAG: integrase core domain-containing protein, partial [Jannaschia sp.]